VVAKVFHLFEPDVAVFGRKDFQQTVLVRRMVEDLDIPVRIEVIDTVRESDGLALSSRNVYLAPDERRRATALPRALGYARALFDAGETDPVTLAAAVRRVLAEAGLEPEYVAVVDPATLELVRRARMGDVLAVAVRVGAARLIDNTVFGVDDALPA
jgi:pantoate--beta-alanine ligase